ncbi:hypothetical protein [Yinghuangia sp. YIM S10712]|uniref:hypothetical protein n=1 Tax=Yinghuangia sp. YIM S10712 TaxID=3436930 RepID=UPI003F534EFF
MLELATALRLAWPDVAAALVRRFPAEVVRTLAEYAELRPDTVARILADGEFDVVGYFTGGPRGKHATDLLLRAARLGDPATAADLYRRRNDLDPAVVDAVLANIADQLDDGWYAGDGLVEQMRRALHADPVAAATSPFAALVYTAAADSCAKVPFAVAVDLCVAVADRGTPSDLRALAKEDLGHPGLAAMLLQAADAPSPSAHLADRRPPEEWMDPEAVRAFVQLRVARRLPPVDAPKPPLDWELIRTEHERAPFSDIGLAWLTGWDDCPADLVKAAFREDPSSVTASAARITSDMLDDRVLDRWPRAFAQGLERGLAQGSVTTDLVFAEVRPASRVLASLPDTPSVADALGELFAPLGDDPGRWLTLYARLPRFQGTARELVRDVCAAKPTERWPRPLDAVFPATEPENTRAVFLRLVCAMPDAVAIALAPCLDVRAAQHLLVFHTVSDAVRDAVVAAHGTAALAAYAASYRLTDAEVQWLLDHDEPAVDAMLFAHARLGDDERVRILSGVLRAGGRRRVGDEVLDVLREINLGHYRARVTAGLSGGDPGVAEVIVSRLRLGTEGGRLRLLTAVWEHHGPGAVRPLLDPRRLTARTVKTVSALLDAPDGLDRLRARLAAEDAPDRVVAYLAKKAADPEELLRRGLQEGMPLPWPELAEAARDGRLPAGMIALLVRQPGCPREFGLAAVAAYAGLDEHGTPYEADWRQWLLREGVLTPEEMLRHVTRPSAWLSLVAHDPRVPWEDVTDEPCAEARALTAELLGDDVEAWAVAVRLFADFAGTLPELLATARSAVA